MKNQFNFEAIPFAPGNDESETDNSPQSVRRLQQALNRELGVQMPLDGVMSFRMRKAIRNFQRHKGLSADGIVGSRTKCALIQASSGESTKESDRAPNNDKSPSENKYGFGLNEWEMMGDYEEFIPQILGEKTMRERNNFDELWAEYGENEVEGPWIWDNESGIVFEHQLPRPATPAPAAPRPLTATQIANAVRTNRLTARQFGWGNVVGGQVLPSTGVRSPRALNLGAGTVTEEVIAQSVTHFQQTVMRKPGSGIIDKATFDAMIRNGAFPNLRRRKAWAVRFGGAELGVIEQITPYIGTQPNPAQRGVQIQFGFRVTNMAAVRRAGFVDASGEDNFRWLQIIELRRIGDPTRNLVIQRLRRSGYGRIIDPTVALERAEHLDAVPYYWDEVTLPGANPGNHVSNFRDIEAANGLCYDWIFFDAPRFNVAAAQAGRLAYFNFETALVGIRRQRNGDICNVLLNSVLWGFDIIQKGATHQLKENRLQAGRYGGSLALRQWLNRELNRTDSGGFPRHHFHGSVFTGKARCS